MTGALKVVLELKVALELKTTLQALVVVLPRARNPVLACVGMGTSVTAVTRPALLSVITGTAVAAPYCPAVVTSTRAAELIALAGKLTVPRKVVLQSVVLELKTRDPVPVVTVVPVPPLATGNTPEVIIEVSIVDVVVVVTRPLVSVVITGNPEVLPPTVVAIPTFDRTELGSVPVLRIEASREVRLDASITLPFWSICNEGTRVVLPNHCAVADRAEFLKESGSLVSSIAPDTAV